MTQALRKVQQSITAPVAGTRGTFRLGDLVSSAHNVRKERRTAEAIRDMAISIHYHGGVLQNLLLVPELVDGVWTGKLGAAGGETRRLALCLLRDGGIEGAEGYTDDYEVPGLVVSAPEATAVSATENYRRKPLHPADEFEAFRELYEQCGSVEHVAAFFAATPLMVEQRLRLANASPKLFQVYRDGGMDIEQLMALCLTDDHDLQERVWKNGERNQWLRDTQQLRRALTQGKVSLTGDRLARFVGAQAYIDAGGHVMRDLFSANGNDGYITDAALLQRLAMEKLEGVAAMTSAEGWPWVEVLPVFEYAEQARYSRCDVRKRKLTATEAEEHARLEKRLAKLRKEVQAAREADKLDTPAAADARLECAEIQAAIDKIDAARCTVDSAARPFAGAVVSIDQSGAVQVHRGLIKPEHRKAHAKAEKARAREKHQAASDARVQGSGSRADVPESPAGHSEALMRRLTSHRTIALQRVLADKTHVALAALAHNYVQRLWSETHWPSSALAVKLEDCDSTLLQHGEEALESGRAWTELKAMREAWGDRLPGEEAQLLPWLIALPFDELCNLLALCAALSVNAVSGTEREHAADALATAVGLDMADWWEVSGENYLQHVPKARIVASVEEAVSPAEAAPLANLKKGELVARAQAAFAGKRWLPSPLRARG